MSDVESELRGIGEMARVSGLTVSALRFYDRAGVLAPAEVDALSGYRRYREDQVRAARLIASLRRVGMPLAEITAAVRALPDPVAVRTLLDRHLRRLEDGLTDARRELSHAHTLLELEASVSRVTLPIAALAAALDAVRFAAGKTPNPEIPMLAGILFEAGDDTLTLVATDRFRLAVASVPAVVAGPPIRVVVPAELTTILGAPSPGTPSPGGERDIELTLESDRVVIGDAEGKPVEGDYPDFRRLVRDPEGPRVTVDVAAAKEAIAAAPDQWREHEGVTYPLVNLTVGSDGELMVVADGGQVAVNRDFLLQALDAGGAGQLVLELDGPIHPLAVRGGQRDRFSLLMPVRH